MPIDESSLGIAPLSVATPLRSTFRLARRFRISKTATSCWTPMLPPAHQELARQRATDELKKNLGKRPGRDELVERNILPAPNTAPALQAHARDLERHMLADNLEHKIQNRPGPEELISQGILEEDEDPRST
ncbi:hypothetical protein N7540_010512 [Penicillium herquei]|nr:hypothetical protein N7540_010512 [Penicillium herquei]